MNFFSPMKKRNAWDHRNDPIFFTTMKKIFFFLVSLPTFFFLSCSSSDQADIREYPVRISNLGALVNSSKDDFSPSISANGAILFFTSDRKQKGTTGGQDFWRSTYDGNFWSLPENVAAPINTPDHEGSLSISSDGQSLYFAACDRADAVGRCDIYFAELKGKEWSSVKNIGAPVNSPAWESQPSISSDGRTLYFVSDRKGGFGGLDIWKSEKGANGAWLPPVNPGPTINTAKDETSPFIASDRKTLYFASEGHPGLGGSDMFVTRFVNGSWLKPVNLGKPLNSPDNDEFYTLTAEGNIVWFASRREGGIGGYDLYRGEPNPFPPGAVAVLSGVVRDKKTKSPLGADLILRDKKNGTKIAEYKSNAYSGEFLIVLPAGVHYELTVQSATYLPEKDAFDLTSKETYEEIHRDYLLRKDEPAPKLAASVTADVLTSDFSILKSRNVDVPGLTMEEIVYNESIPLLNYIFFEKGSANIPERYIRLSTEATNNFLSTAIEHEALQYYRNILNIFGNRLRADASINVTLTGCNDNTDVEKGNISLSRERAEAVKKYFVEIWKIEPQRISIEAMNLPVNKSTINTEEGREENRRVEIHSTAPGFLMPVEIRDVQRLIKPPSVLFNLSIEAQAGIDRWKFSVTQDGKEKRASDGYTQYPDSLRWDWKDASGNLPSGQSPLIFTLEAKDKTGAEVKTEPQEIPVRQITLEKKNIEKLPDRTIEKVSLILFDFDRTEIGERNRSILENAARKIQPQSKVILRGYTDASGEESYNLRLSEKRAESSSKALSENMRFINLRSEGVGEAVLLYPNDTPEGRFYCRTVQILIETQKE